MWLAKCCKIQQLAPAYSTAYIYVQQHIFKLIKMVNFKLGNENVKVN